ncbi:MAG: hypothetical protein J6S83_00890 [Lachnospiraceae bacterium]|nr:hypothetical protein [Lachnospiraceae bacterium]
MSKARDGKQKSGKVRRFFRNFFCLTIVLLLGVCIGIHWKVIKAWAEGDELPKAPEGHCCGWCHK